MVVSVIQSQISTADLTLKPGYSTATLDVEVVNNSDRQASFHIVLAATGNDGQPPRRWYHLFPMTSSKVPPGTHSRYTINIVDSPLPGFVGLANITVRIISPELQSEERHVLRLRVEPGFGTASFKVDLPIQTFQDYPGQVVEMPARIYNSSRNPISVLISCPGIENWLLENSPTNLRLLPNRWHDSVIVCQIPEDLTLCRSQEYPFQVLVVDNDGDSATASGVLEVLPLGYFELVAEQTKLTIPTSLRWLPDRRATSTQTQFRLENHSNLSDTLQIKALPSNASTQEADDRDWQVTIEPDAVLLDPGQTGSVEVAIQVDRPWLGWVRTLWIDIQARLEKAHLDLLRNHTQTLQIRVFPIIPRWLQALAILLLAGAIAGFWLYQIYGRHHSQLVSAVQFNGIGSRIISGSHDQTVRQWHVQQGRLRPTKYVIQLDKAVRVLNYRPVDNNRIAIGLENGEIQLWDLLKRPSRPLRTLVKQSGQQNDLDDRVLALTTTTDARRLFSGHGSGIVYQWYIGPDSTARDLDSQQPTNQIVIPELAIYDLALIGPGDQALAIAGRYNKLQLWDWSQAAAQNSTEISGLAIEDNADTALFSIDYPFGGQDDYITSLATAEQKPFRLVTADTRGWIMVWDLENCLDQTRQCMVVDQWQVHSDAAAIRDISLSSNGCYLVSAGDDGRVMLWLLTEQGRRLTQHLEGQIVKQTKTRFNSVDIKILESHILIVSGAEDKRVRLHRLKKPGQVCQN